MLRAMGIGSRSYVRPYAMGGGLPEGIKLLLIANVVVFFLQYFGLGSLLTEYFALQPAAVLGSFAVWQLVTYTFLHGGLFHILFNMLALWMFGRELEAAWGTRTFLRFYFFCGIGAGVCIVLANYLFGNPASITIGASGAIYGILLASAVMWPDRLVYFWGIFPLAMKYMVMIYGAIAFLGSTNFNSGVSDIGHLGGLLCGWIFLKAPALSGTRSRARSPRIGPLAAIQQRYKLWKVERNKRKFQVYMKKHGSNRDVN
jgi:membrane associated rhomboid family serine protease